MTFQIHSKTLMMACTLLAALFLTAHAEKKPAFTPSVQSVYDHYLQIQSRLAGDSAQGVSEHANAIAKAIRSDKKKILPPDVAKQADTLAAAKDLKAMRAAFKPLSESLIKYLADTKTGKGVYREAYCPMVRASWLQTGKTIANPYMGNEMPTCGTFRN